MAYDKISYNNGVKRAKQDKANLDRVVKRYKNNPNKTGKAHDFEWVTSYKRLIKDNLIYHKKERESKTINLKRKSFAAGYVAQASRYKL